MQYNISIFTENQIGLLQRVASILTRRHINVESITASESEIPNVHRLTVVVDISEDQVKKLVGQLEKQVEVVKAFYHDNSEVIQQEIALYKVPTSSLSSGSQVEKIIRDHQARVLTIDSDYTIIEKTGHKEETQQLFDELHPFGILEFVRSGRIAITKPMKEFKDYMKEVETSSLN